MFENRVSLKPSAVSIEECNVMTNSEKIHGITEYLKL